MVAIKEYKRALFQLIRINKIQKQEESITGEKKKEVEDKYWELKIKLREKQDKLASNKCKEISNIDSKYSIYINRLNIEKQPYNNIRNNVEDIFKMFDIFISENEKPTVFDNIPSDEKCLGVLEVLYDDKYKRVYVYAKHNNKPKNNLTLAIKVESLFRYYFNIVNMTTRDMKYAPTLGDITGWFRNNKDNLKWEWGNDVYLSDIMKEQFRLEKLYEDAQVFWEKKGWRRVYWNYKKYYYENNYSHGTETEEYKYVLEQLRILK